MQDKICTKIVTYCQTSQPSLTCLGHAVTVGPDLLCALCRYYLVVWRRPKFFLFNYIQPAVLINIIALFVFLIPAESGEKVTL